jgi:hypothetical protein
MSADSRYPPTRVLNFQTHRLDAGKKSTVWVLRKKSRPGEEEVAGVGRLGGCVDLERMLGRRNDD